MSLEVVTFFHKVIEDGRFIDTWTIEPTAVAKSLQFKLSIEAIDRILGSSAIVGRLGDVANLSIEQGIVVGVVAVVLVVVKPQPESVRDFSGLNKF